VNRDEVFAVLDFPMRKPTNPKRNRFRFSWHQ
jgi:hypothetical protein